MCARLCVVDRKCYAGMWLIGASMIHTGSRLCVELESLSHALCLFVHNDRPCTDKHFPPGRAQNESAVTRQSLYIQSPCTLK